MFNLMSKINESLSYAGVAFYAFALFCLSFLFIAVSFWGVRNIIKIKKYKQHSYFWMSKNMFWTNLIAGVLLILLGLFLMSFGIKRGIDGATYGMAFEEMMLSFVNLNSVTWTFDPKGVDFYVLLAFLTLFITMVVILIIKRKYNRIAAQHNNKVLKALSSHQMVFDRLVFDLKHKLQPAHLTYTYDMIQRIKKSVYLESDFKKLVGITDINDLITTFPKNTFYLDTIEKDHEFAGTDGLFELNKGIGGRYILHKNLLMPSSGHVEKAWGKKTYLTTNPRDKHNVELHNFLTWMDVKKMIITTPNNVEEVEVVGIDSALHQIQSNLDRIFNSVKRGDSVLVRYNFMDNYSFIQFAQYFDYCKEEIKEIKAYEDEILKGKTGLI